MNRASVALTQCMCSWHPQEEKGQKIHLNNPEMLQNLGRLETCRSRNFNKLQAKKMNFLKLKGKIIKVAREKITLHIEEQR